MSDQQKKKVMILGGGCGALAAAFALTDRAEDRDRFCVTIYQPGWRLGGKGASGRNGEHGQRIEEHGLHIWSGFYENAFWMMRRCYRELDRPATAPLASAFSAFRARHYTAMTAPQDSSGWAVWKGYLPHETGLPGDAIDPERYKVLEHPPTPWELLSALIPWSLRYLQATTGIDSGKDVEPLGAGQWWLRALWRRQRLSAGRWRRRLLTASDVAFLAIASARILCAYKCANDYHYGKKRRSAKNDQVPAAFLRLARRLSCLQKWAGRKRAQRHAVDLNETSLLDLAELFVTLLMGMLHDNVIERGFDVLDHEDLSAWLMRHGASEAAVKGPTMVALHCYIFAYEDGDPERPRLAAGTALRFSFRLILCSRGAVFWEMMAGMGDTVFAPLYEVLKRRGVKFKFFHRAAEVRAAHPGVVDEIEIEQQVKTRGAPYVPLINVRGLPCWPSEPLMDQLDLDPSQRAYMRAHRRQLESEQSRWPGSTTEVLKRGQDFDHVILATSVAPLLDIAKPLLAHESSPFSKAVMKLKTVGTIGMQLWMNWDTQGLGWRSPPPILTSYEKPLDTWADMTQTLAVENWVTGAPRSVQYFCGTLSQANLEAVRPAASGDDALWSLAGRWLTRYAAELWPQAIAAQHDSKAAPPQHPFQAGVLFVPPSYKGSELASQWITANTVGSERYVLSLPGGTQWRLRGDESGYQNMSIAGDWLRTGLNYGCVESAVIGGFQAARAVCGYPKVIHGENDFAPTRQEEVR